MKWNNSRNSTQKMNTQDLTLKTLPRPNSLHKEILKSYKKLTNVWQLVKILELLRPLWISRSKRNKVIVFHNFIEPTSSFKSPNLRFYGFLEYILCNADMVNDVHWSVLGLDIFCHDLVEVKYIVWIRGSPQFMISEFVIPTISWFCFRP